MSDIVFARVDDRLIHGQVVYRWLNHINVSELCIIDDDLSKDFFIQKVLQSMLSTEIRLNCLDITEASKYLVEKGKESNKRVMLLTKTPLIYYRLLKNGVKIEQINIGCMGNSGKRKNFYKDLYGTKEEIKAIRSFIKLGIRVDYQVRVSNVPENFSEILK